MQRPVLSRSVEQLLQMIASLQLQSSDNGELSTVDLFAKLNFQVN